MATYNFVPLFHEATFCGVPSCVFDKSGCVAGKKKSCGALHYGETALDAGEWSAWRPGHIIPGKQPGYPLGGPQNRSVDLVAKS
jgi:hypothetical protein